MSATAWVVLGSAGQYSDWSQWAVCVCADEQMAKDRVGELTSAIRIHMAAKPERADDEEFEDFCDRTEEARAAWQAGFAAIDPEADGYDEPCYRTVEVPYLTNAVATATHAPQVEGDRSRDAQNPLQQDKTQ